MSLYSKHADIGLQGRIDMLLSGVRTGEEDPILAALLGDEVSDIVRSTGINSLVINPGSTSTKLDVFSGLRLVSRDEVSIAPGTPDSVDARVNHIISWLDRQGLNLSELTGIAARGGFMAPIPTGTYTVCDQMLTDLSRAKFNHPANISVPMALKIREMAGLDVQVTVTDPVVCDEVDSVYRITGTPSFMTDGAATHYLNIKAACALVAYCSDLELSTLHLVACHMGGGFSAGRYQSGHMAQVLHAFGSMPSANRSGSLPLKDLLVAVMDGKYSLDDLRRDVTGSGAGLLGLAGTNDFRALFSFRKSAATSEQRKKIDLVIDFFATRVAAGILELSATTEPVDAIILTGGIARNDEFCSLVASRIHLNTPVLRVAGSVEAESLNAGFLTAYVRPESRKDYRLERDRHSSEVAQVAELLETSIFEKAGKDHREGLMPSSIDEIISAAIPRGELPVVGLLGADNEEALLAAMIANQEHRLARFVLIGDYTRIAHLSWELDIPLDDDNFFLVDSENPAETGMQMLFDGRLDTLMKGSITTSVMLKAFLGGMKKLGRATRATKLSHLCLFDIPGRNKLVCVTDAAINPSPSLEDRVVIAQNSISALHSLGLVRPKVAVISATEKPSDKVVSSMEAKEIAELFAHREDVLIDGPISVDLSLSAESAREKGYRGNIQGDADLMLVPDLDVGNAVYKTFTTISGATAAGTVVGGEIPLILTSRGDSTRTKLASIALSLLLGRISQKRRTP